MKFTVEPEKKSNLVEQIRKHAPGTLQSRLSGLAGKIREEQGGALLDRVSIIGDHTAGLATVFSTLGFVDLDKSMPVLGHVSQHVRAGKTLVFAPETGAIEKVPVVIEPDKSQLFQ